MSPYGPTYLPDFNWMSWALVEFDQAIIQLNERAPVEGACKRDAILLMAAKIALQLNYSHFDFVKDPRIPKESLSHIRNPGEKIIPVFLCRGVCPTMYSAVSIAHMLSYRFSFNDSSVHEDATKNKCL
jgi:hypothetical protein